VPNCHESKLPHRCARAADSTRAARLSSSRGVVRRERGASPENDNNRCGCDGRRSRPKTEVEGAIRAARSLGVKVILVGREELIREELDKHEEASALADPDCARQRTGQYEESAAKTIRGKRDSSIRVACRLVRDGVPRAWSRRVTPAR